MPELPILLNIGGTEFATTRQTLAGSELLSTLCDTTPVGKITSTNGGFHALPFLDRSPEYFRPILAFLRSGVLHVPPSLSRQCMQVELDYYHVTASADPPSPPPPPNPEWICTDNDERTQANYIPKSRILGVRIMHTTSIPPWEVRIYYNVSSTIQTFCRRRFKSKADALTWVNDGF